MRRNFIYWKFHNYYWNALLENMPHVNHMINGCIYYFGLGMEWFTPHHFYPRNLPHKDTSPQPKNTVQISAHLQIINLHASSPSDMYVCPPSTLWLFNVKNWDLCPWFDVSSWIKYWIKYQYKYFNTKIFILIIINTFPIF